MAGYRTLRPGPPISAELERKRSRFVALVRRCDDEPSAREFIDAVRREHPAANHHCTAFRLGPAPVRERSNDDGEPAGTAGAPMLEVLRGGDFSDVAAVVVRYFGGALLGTGGLVRAYADAVSSSLADAYDQGAVRRREPLEAFELKVPHDLAGRLEADLRGHGVLVQDLRYAQMVTLRVATRAGDQLRDRVASVSAGRIEPVGLGQVWVDRPAPG